MKLLLLLTLLLTHFVTAKALEKVSLQLMWKDQFQFAGYYVAKEKGFYQEAGLEVEIKPFWHNLNPVEEVLHHRATYGIGRSSLIADISNGKDIQLLAAIFQSSPLVLLSLQREDLQTIQDFVGKKIMLTSDAFQDALIHAMMIKNGITKKEVSFIPYSGSIDDLITGKTDLMEAYISNEPFLLRQRGIDYTLFNPKAYGFDFYSDILFTRGEEVTQHPQRTKRFKEASLRGWRYAFTHIDETIAIILQHYNTQHKSKEALLYEAYTLKGLAYSDYAPLGNIDIQKLYRIYDIYNMLGLVSHHLDQAHFMPSHKGSITLTPKEKSYIQQLGQLSICITPDLPPIEYEESGTLKGISVDMLRLIGRKLHTKIAFVKTENPKSSLAYLQAGRCHLALDIPQAKSNQKTLRTRYEKNNVSSPSHLDTYHRSLYFTQPFVEYNLDIIQRSDHPLVKDLSLLHDKRIVLKNASVKNHLAKLSPNLTVIQEEEIREILKLLESGEADLTLLPLPIFNYYRYKYGYHHLQVAGHTDLKHTETIAIDPHHATLLPILNKMIDSISQEERNFIFEKWTNVTIIKRVDYTLLWQVLIGALVIVSIIIFLLIKQKRLQAKIEAYNANLEQSIQEELKKNREKDKQLLQQSKLAQMGEMISMIAHQWRQPLTTISATSVALQLKAELGDVDRKEIIKTTERISEYAQHLSRTIDDFRDFFKPTKAKEETTVSKLIQSVLSIVAPLLEGKGITIQTQIENDTSLYTYINELKQVLLNLIQNAQDVLIERHITSPRITIRSFTKGENIILEIADNGGGIEEEIMEQIFDPYFSTKSKNGTGLGLYMAKVIIEEHCGSRLEAYNNIEGAVFRIEFIKDTIKGSSLYIVEPR